MPLTLETTIGRERAIEINTKSDLVGEAPTYLDLRSTSRTQSGSGEEDMSHPAPISDFKRQEFPGPELGLDALFTDARTYNFRKGTHLYLQGDEFHGMFLVRSGIVGLRHVDVFGSSMLSTMHWPGAIFGDETLMSQSPYETSAVVMASGKISWISPTIARRRLFSNYSMCLALLASTAKRIDVMTAALMNYVTQPAHVRLGKILLLLAEHSGEPLLDLTWSFTLPLTHQELAEAVGVRAETLSRAIGNLRTRRLLKADGDQMTLMNVPRLKCVVFETPEVAH